MKQNLKVAFIVRSTFDQVKGGDSLQLLNTAAELRKLGVEVDIKKAYEKVDYKNYDLLHLFNIIRPADHLKHISQPHTPYVVSTIYLDYTSFDISSRSQSQKMVFSILGKNGSEYLKNLYRFARKQDKLVSKDYLFGHARALRKIVVNARLLLPNSISEYQRLKQDYAIDKPFHVIPNGIDKGLFEHLPNLERKENQVLCVGQLYGLKNQHSLIEATRDKDISLVLIGKAPPNHKEYYEYCKKIAHKNVQFHDFMPQQELIQYYAQSKVHALPSWFETTGLSSLEAGAMGCNLVVGSGGDTKDYFNNVASFCHADNMESIRSALTTELQKSSNFNFREYVLQHYTWEQAAKETLTAYQKALNID